MLQNPVCYTCPSARATFENRLKDLSVQKCKQMIDSIEAATSAIKRARITLVEFLLLEGCIASIKDAEAKDRVNEYIKSMGAAELTVSDLHQGLWVFVGQVLGGQNLLC